MRIHNSSAIKEKYCANRVVLVFWVLCFTSIPGLLFGAITPPPPEYAPAWVIKSLQSVLESGLLAGYPDGLFKGEEPLTRVEAAALVYRIQKEIENQRALTDKGLVDFAKADQLALVQDAVAAMSEELAGELAQVQAKLDEYEKKLDSLTSRIKALTGEIPPAPVVEVPQENPPEVKPEEKTEEEKPKLKISGYRSLKYRTYSASGDEYRFLSQNGLIQFGKKLEQSTDLRVTGNIQNKLQLEGSFYEMPNQERKLRVKAESDSLGVQAGIFSATIEGGSLASFGKEIQGLQFSYRFSNFNVGFLYSESKSEDELDSFNGANIKGPYKLKGFPIVEGSEQIWINNNPVPAADYTMDYFLGEITFKDIIDPTQSVRITYQSQLLFSQKGGNISGFNAGYKSGSEKLKIGSLYLVESAVRSAQSVVNSSVESCVVWYPTTAGTPPSDYSVCRFVEGSNLLILSNQYIEKGFETVEIQAPGESSFSIKECSTGVEPEANELCSISFADYAVGHIDFTDTAAAVPARSVAEQTLIRVSYTYYPQDEARPIIDEELTSATGAAQTEFTLQTEGRVYFGAEIAFFVDEPSGIETIMCRGASQRPECAGKTQSDYIIDEENNLFIVTNTADFLVQNDDYIKISYIRVPRISPGSSKYDKTVTGVTADWKPNSHLSFSAEFATSQSDLSSRPVQILEERIAVSDFVTLPIIDEMAICSTSAVCAVSHHNLVSGTEIVEFIPIATGTPSVVAPADYSINEDESQITFTGIVIPPDTFVRVDYNYRPCWRKYCELANPNVVPNSETIHINDTISESSLMQRYTDYSLNTDRGLITFADPLGAEDGVVFVDYQYYPSFTGLATGSAYRLAASTNFSRLSLGADYTHKDPAYTPLGSLGSSELNRLSASLSFQVTDDIGLSFTRTQSDTAITMDEKFIMTQVQDNIGLNYGGDGFLKSLRLYRNTQDRSDNFAPRKIDSAQETNGFTLAFAPPILKGLNLDLGWEKQDTNDDSLTATPASDLSTTKLDYGFSYQPKTGSLSLTGRYTANEISSQYTSDSGATYLPFSTTTASRNLRAQYTLAELAELSLNYDSQQKSDSRPEIMGQTINAIQGEIRVMPFWRVRSMIMTFSQNDSPSNVGGGIRTQVFNTSFAISITQTLSFTPSYTSTEATVGSTSSSANTTKGFVLDYSPRGPTGLSAALTYQLGERSTTNIAGTTTSDETTTTLDLRYRLSEKMTFWGKYSLRSAGGTPSSDNLIMTVRGIYTPSEVTKLTLDWTRQDISGGAGNVKDTVMMELQRRLSEIIYLNMEGKWIQYSDSNDSTMNNSGTILTTEFKAQF